MLKLLTLLVISVSFVFSTELKHEDILAFLQNSFSAQKTYKFENVTIHSAQKLENLNGWDAYFVTLNFIAYDNEVLIKDVLFYDGEHISRDFYLVKENKSLKGELLENWDKNTKKGVE